MLNIKTSRIKTTEKTLRFADFKNERNCRFYNDGSKEGGVINCVVVDPDFNGGKRGSEMNVLISRGKNREFGKRVILAVLDIQEPIQSDLEDYLLTQ